MKQVRRPDLAAEMSKLKDFQRATVEHVHRRLWTDSDHAKRFLVADEVGLGKTMVARGTIAKTLDHLWDTVRRIDVVYICSNAQIARQNLSRLNLFGDTMQVDHADRLTMLPRALGELRSRKVNFVSFTPGTSFHIGDSGGRQQERILLYELLAQAWGRDAVGSPKWTNFFRGGVGFDRFQAGLHASKGSRLDTGTVQAFHDRLATATRNGYALREEIEECVDQFDRRLGEPSTAVKRDRYQLIGALRQHVAHASVHALEPDLVILDEFQRFKDLLNPANPGADLAHALFDHSDARVLLLSATPYKMYTLPDEPEGDDHYADFLSTVEFLAGPDRAYGIGQRMHTIRQSLLVGENTDVARKAKTEVEQELRRVMSRTERLAVTPDRDAMIAECDLPDVALRPEDVRAYRFTDDVAHLVEPVDMIEYWRSASYLFNLMDNYKIKRKLSERIDRLDPNLAALFQHPVDVLDWDDIRSYRQLHPANAKLRGLITDVLDRGVWRLAWLPPALPYYDLGGAYADSGLRAFTKRMVFSAWTVVPKAISVVLSYEAERRALDAAGLTSRGYEHRPAPLLRFQESGGRLTGMPVLALLYASSTLARLGDPLRAAQHLGLPLPLPGAALRDAVRAEVVRVLDDLPDGNPDQAVDQRWYWAAPFLLDLEHLGGAQRPLLPTMFSRGDDDSDEPVGQLRAHVQLAQQLDPATLGRRPDDLVDVLVKLAVAGPGVCALRSLSRVCGATEALDNVDIRAHAMTMSWGLRSLFNRPETVTLLRATSDEDADRYWTTVLDHCWAGGLTAVLDEYVHTLVESEGLQGDDPTTRASKIAPAVADALRIRSVTNAVDDLRLTDGHVVTARHLMRVNLAVRFGRGQDEDKTVVRESHVRSAFNSPFAPFVLASTSVGQEGLDFHTYCHAVVHWNLPGNPVDLEQREGRVHRFKGHAVRKNVAQRFGAEPALTTAADPWTYLFDRAAADRPEGDSDLVPYWVYPLKDGAHIERYVPALPLSKETERYGRLRRTITAYRLVFGQPRQDDLIRYLDSTTTDHTWLRIDLSPPPS
ncbi:helicase-related protein [Amycolatopsis sp. NPDC051128]|uniref:DEAD/DEAH box helicase n=1 Tax=Amycolatopsis sp. NPDC051128 TaxID=3155412 RepID=UPI00341EC006